NGEASGQARGGGAPARDRAAPPWILTKLRRTNCRRWRGAARDCPTFPVGKRAAPVKRKLHHKRAIETGGRLPEVTIVRAVELTAFSAKADGSRRFAESAACSSQART